MRLATGQTEAVEVSVQNQRFFWVTIAAAAWLLAGGITNKKSASSAAQRPAPEAIRGTCPAVPNDAAPIAGLQTARAIRDASLPGLRLVFADHALACRDLPRGPVSMAGDPCVSSWEFAFTLPPEAQQPGVYNLNDYQADYAESFSASLPGGGDGCRSGGGCVGGGTGAAGGAKGPDSTIEIYSVSEECITGRILRLERGSGTGVPDFTGTFQALVCTTEQ